MKKTSYILSLVSILNMSAETIGVNGASLVGLKDPTNEIYANLVKEISSSTLLDKVSNTLKGSDIQGEVKAFILHNISHNDTPVKPQIIYIGGTIDECRFEELESELEVKNGIVSIDNIQNIQSNAHILNLFMPNSFKNAFINLVKDINTTGSDLDTVLDSFKSTDPDTLVLKNTGNPADITQLTEADNILDPNYSGSTTIADVVDIMKTSSYRDNTVTMNLHHINSQVLPLQLTENDYILNIVELYNAVLNLDSADTTVASVLSVLYDVVNNTVLQPGGQIGFEGAAETALLEWFINLIMKKGLTNFSV